MVEDVKEVKPPILSDNPVTARNIFDLAEEPTEYKEPGAAPANTEWKAPEDATKPTVPVVEQPKYTDEYYRFSGKNTAGMTSEITTTGMLGLNHWLMKRKLNKIMEEEEFLRVQLIQESTPDKLTPEQKTKLAKIAKVITEKEKMADEIKWTKQETDQLGDSFYEYQKFTQKPLPPWIMIGFSFAKKVLKIVNAYIFS